MGITKNILIGGKEVAFRASAATPRLYRQKFQRDIIKDFAHLQKKAKEVLGDKATSKEDLQVKQFDIVDLGMFENLAYIMAYQADRTIPESVDEWLDDFDTFSIYEVLPVLMDLWVQNNKTIEKPKNA